MVDLGYFYYNDCFKMWYERKLGFLEIMYYVYYICGVDIYV